MLILRSKHAIVESAIKFTHEETTPFIPDPPDPPQAEGEEAGEIQTGRKCPDNYELYYKIEGVGKRLVVFGFVIALVDLIGVAIGLSM